MQQLTSHEDNFPAAESKAMSISPAMWETTDVGTSLEGHRSYATILRGQHS